MFLEQKYPGKESDQVSYSMCCSDTEQNRKDKKSLTKSLRCCSAAVFVIVETVSIQVFSGHILLIASSLKVKFIIQIIKIVDCLLL